MIQTWRQIFSDLHRLRKHATHRPFLEKLLRKALLKKKKKKESKPGSQEWDDAVYKRVASNEAGNVYTLNYWEHNWDIECNLYK